MRSQDSTYRRSYTLIQRLSLFHRYRPCDWFPLTVQWVTSCTAVKHDLLTLRVLSISCYQLSHVVVHVNNYTLLKLIVQVLYVSLF